MLIWRQASLALLAHGHPLATLSPLSLRVRSLEMTADRALYQQRLDNLAQRKQGVISTPEQPLVLELHSALPHEWGRVVSALSPFVKARQVLRLQAALRKRRSRLHLVLENIADPHNSAAVVRAAEACGVQHVHVIESVCSFRTPVATSRAASAGDVEEAQEAMRWLTIYKYKSTRQCIERLDQLGIQESDPGSQRTLINFRPLSFRPPPLLVLHRHLS